MEKNEETFDQSKKSFISKITKTKYCHINAAKRCEEWRDFLFLASFCYNILLILFSIFSISFLREYYWLNIIITVLSVVVFTISLFVFSLFVLKNNEPLFKSKSPMFCSVSTISFNGDFTISNVIFTHIIPFTSFW